jgi:hypothetical protein
MERRKKEKNVQSCGTLCSSSLLVDVGALQQLLVLGFQQRITSGRLCKNKESHCCGGVSGRVGGGNRGTLL